MRKNDVQMRVNALIAKIVKKKNKLCCLCTSFCMVSFFFFRLLEKPEVQPGFNDSFPAIGALEALDDSPVVDSISGKQKKCHWNFFKTFISYSKNKQKKKASPELELPWTLEDFIGLRYKHSFF